MEIKQLESQAHYFGKLRARLFNNCISTSQVTSINWHQM